MSKKRKLATIFLGIVIIGILIFGLFLGDASLVLENAKAFCFT